MTLIKKQIIYWIPVYLYMLLIFYFSSQSIISLGVGGGGGGDFPIVPYLKHSFEYFILGGLLFRGFVNSKYRKKSLILSLSLGTLYGISDEIHQLFVIGRTFSSLDIVFDIIGVVIGILVIKIFYKLLK